MLASPIPTLAVNNLYVAGGWLGEIIYSYESAVRNRRRPDVSSLAVCSILLRITLQIKFADVLSNTDHLRKQMKAIVVQVMLHL